MDEFKTHLNNCVTHNVCADSTVQKGGTNDFQICFTIFSTQSFERSYAFYNKLNELVPEIPKQGGI